MNFYFLMDPLEWVQVKKDTSFAFMEEAAGRGHRTFYVPNDGVSFQQGAVNLRAQAVLPTREGTEAFEACGWSTVPASEADAIFIRSEPPFDARYIENTWLLDLAKEETLILNDPTGIRSANEKLWALQFPDFVPRSAVLRSGDDLKSFLAEEGKIIVKPTDGFGGKGVFLVDQGDPNASVIFETLTNNGQQAVIAQQFIAEADQGDKRILLLNGEPLGAVLRVHGEHDHRNNFFAGGSAQKATLTSRDLEVCNALKPYLQREGLVFTGIDMIGDYLIEVNVTSPTCIQEMCALDGVNYTAQVIDYVEATCRS